MSETLPPAAYAPSSAEAPSAEATATPLEPPSVARAIRAGLAEIPARWRGQVAHNLGAATSAPAALTVPSTVPGTASTQAPCISPGSVVAFLDALCAMLEQTGDSAPQTPPACFATLPTLCIDGEAPLSAAFRDVAALRRILLDLCFEAGVRPSLDDVQLIHGALDHALDALVRAFEASHHSATRHLRFMMKAGDLLASTLDYEATLSHVARLAVPQLADWCLVEMVAEDQPLRLVAAAHVDPDKVAPLIELERHFAYDPRLQFGPLHVLRTGRPGLVPSISLEMLREFAAIDTDLALLSGLTLGSYLGVPIVVREDPVGVISLIRSEGREAYDDDDVVQAQDFARRCALVIENSRLFEEARDAILARDEFISVAAHELKAPVAALKIHVELLRRLAGTHSVAELPPRRLESSFTAIERMTLRLVELVEHLLDVSKIAAGRLELRVSEVDLRNVAADVIERFSDALAESGSTVTLRAERPVMARVDVGRIDQVLSNLVSNAVKYGEGRPIEIEIDMDGGCARMSVCDEGPGIAPEHHHRIFERFQRASSDQAHESLGLGLYIARQIVHSHGGTVHVDSQLGRGATFTVLLPADTGAGA